MINDPANSGKTIELTANIDNHGETCIDWDNSDITFDCKGTYHIYGDGDEYDVGIFIDGGANTIQNCEISGFGLGIGFGSSGNTIEGNTLNSNEWGLHIISDNNQISDNTINSNKEHGIYLEDASNNQISSNTVRSNSYGIYLTESSNNEISSNTLNMNFHGIYLDQTSTDNKVSDNIACSNGQNDIYVSSDSSATADSDDNQCDITENYDDQGATGCTSTCSLPKLTLLFIPVNWDSGMSQFDSDAQAHADFVLDNIPLTGCSTEFEVIKSPTDCPVDISTCTPEDVNDALYKIRECADATGETYLYAVGLEDSDICGGMLAGTAGVAMNVPAILARSNDETVTAHELGHMWGLNEEYYDACRCNGPGLLNPDANCLDAAMGGTDPWDGASGGPDPDYCAGGVKCDPGDSIAPRCLGNKPDPLTGGRCIMGYGAGPEPRTGFCSHCIDHLEKNPRLTCD